MSDQYSGEISVLRVGERDLLGAAVGEVVVTRGTTGDMTRIRYIILYKTNSAQFIKPIII